MNVNCSICKNIIKKSEEKITCSVCNSIYHKHCWDDNEGCATDDCIKNPKVKAIAENIGNKTLSEIESELNPKQKSDTAKDIQPQIVTTEKVEKETTGFEEEFKTRYKEKLNFRNRRKVLLYISIGMILITVLSASVFSYIKLNEYYNSEDYKINYALKEWEKSYEEKNVEKYKELLDKDYQYIDKSNKPIGFDERIKRISKTFETTKNIRIKIFDKKINRDTTDTKYINVNFLQEITLDKKEEKNKKTLRFFKSEEAGSKWKIFREYVE